ncbi:hypothetical protein [Nocardiopsis ganjiahuensis]|nr:hypothetical protein [Nocardiopsis ganjiahuensis]
MRRIVVVFALTAAALGAAAMPAAAAQPAPPSCDAVTPGTPAWFALGCWS